MAKDKEKSVNPATAHLKSQKNKALKKSKAAVTAQRNEKLARRNPERLQRQIDELKEMQDAQGGQLRPRDKEHLEQLERDVRAIRKAREAAGIPETPAATSHREDRGNLSSRGRGRGGGRGGSMLGKRRRSDREDSEETDPEVRSIPMPRDTPPPLPRRSQRQRAMQHGAPEKPDAGPVQTSYSSAPQLRNLQKESTAKFVPAAVAARLKQSRGESGKLLEPEEVDALERGGYVDAAGAASEAGREEAFLERASEATRLVDGLAETHRDLEEEEKAFEAEIEGLAEDDDNEQSVDVDVQRDEVVAQARGDVQGVVQEALKEAQFKMLAEEAAGKDAAFDETRGAERHLRHVEMEEVEDEAFAA